MHLTILSAKCFFALRKALISPKADKSIKSTSAFNCHACVDRRYCEYVMVLRLQKYHMAPVLIVTKR